MGGEVEGLNKKNKREKTQGEGQQGGDCQGEGRGEDGHGQINGDGRRLDLGW